MLMMVGGIIVLLHNGMNCSHTIKQQEKTFICFFSIRTLFTLMKILFFKMSVPIILYVIALIQTQL